jgi:hypothetical protein
VQYARLSFCSIQDASLKSQIQPRPPAQPGQCSLFKTCFFQKI